jgi:hypothetical protein
MLTRTSQSCRLRSAPLFLVELNGSAPMVEELTRQLASIDDPGHDRMGDSQVQRAVVVFLEEFPRGPLMELVDQVGELTATHVAGLLLVKGFGKRKEHTTELSLMGTLRRLTQGTLHSL